MRGLTSLYPPEQRQRQGSPTARAAVDAVKAGDDVILWPTDLDGAVRGIVSAVRSGEIAESRIDASVKRILEMKAALGLNKGRLVDLHQVPYVVSRQEGMQFAQQGANEVLTAYLHYPQILP